MVPVYSLTSVTDIKYIKEKSLNLFIKKQFSEHEKGSQLN